MNQIKFAKYLVKHGKINQLSNNLFESDNHLVKIQVKKGRTLIICDCENSSYFGHNQICVHKVAVVIYLSDKTFYKELDKLIEMYQGWIDNQMVINSEMMLEDLKNLRNLK